MRKFTMLTLVLLVVTTIVIGIPKAGAMPNIMGIDETETDRLALLAIKSKITLDPHKVLQSWNDSVDVCLWEGVTCDYRHKRVTRLNLTSKGVGGTLSPFVGNLSFLLYLSLNNNTFRGLIPPQVGSLGRLQILDLRGNEFAGGIPPNISACLKLTHLDLGFNKLSGKIPFELSLLSKLQILRLSRNNLTGNNLSPLSNLTSLQELYLSGQKQWLGGVGFWGKIPQFIGNFKDLKCLALGGNNFTGKIPTSLYNLSNLQLLSLSENLLEGSLPPDFGFFYPQLKWLELQNNQLSGPVPFSLSNLSSLELLELGNNNFTGKFLFDAQNMKNLSKLSIWGAKLGTGEDDDLNFIDTLVNCSGLISLSIAHNYFGGVLPQSIGHLSTKLQELLLYNNQISGSIPSRLSHYIYLERLYLRNNYLTGKIPLEIGKMPKLRVVDFSNNHISGSIPSSLGDLSMLSHLDLSFNKFEGTIPATLGNCKNLLYLYLHHNNLVGNAPHQLFQASSLVRIDLSNNHLQGSLPSEIGDSKELVALEARKNNFTGSLPTTLGRCVALKYLYLSSNSFVGFIPSSFSLLKNLEEVDLSINKLSGQLPAYFSNFSSLVLLNLSFNNLEGDVPSSGVFANLSATKLVGNSKLCGGIPQLQYPSCPNTKSNKKEIVIIAVSISCVLVGLAILYSIFLLHFSRRRRNASSPSVGVQLKEPFTNVSYAMLLKATRGFSAENLIGSGSSGSVYRGTLLLDGEEQAVAIKVINNQRQGVDKSFTEECKALKTIRHRNLVGVITACSSIDHQGNDFRALVYEFMPKGSLERWLYSNPEEDGQVSNLSLLQRLNIAIDVAHALDYLHSGNDTPIIHCDLKPTNILLDEDMAAQVGDFGLVKLLPKVSEQLYSSSSIGVRGTMGYVAPEYGLGLSIHAAGDVYSYGIILLELMTAKKPTDVMFEGGKSLQKFVESALPDRVMEIVDPKLVVDDRDDGDEDQEKKPTDVMFKGGKSLQKSVEPALPDHVMEIVDPKLGVVDRDDGDEDHEKKPTDVMFEGGKRLLKFVKSALPDCVMKIVDPKLGVDDRDDGDEDQEKKPTDVMFEGGKRLQKFVKSTLPDCVMKIVDPKLGVDDRDDGDEDQEKKPTDVMFEGGKRLQKFVKPALPDRGMKIVDPKLGVDDRDDGDEDQEICINLNDTRGSVSKCAFECITSIIMTGIRCSSELPQSRMDIKEVVQELLSQRERLLLCGRHRCQRIL